MNDIFLSYKREDRQRARIIAEALEQHGYSVWWDRKITPGKTFDQVIEEKLNAAKCVIVLWSHQSVLSDWVKEEANEGLQRRILVPILIDDVKIPLGFRRIQAARLIGWQGKLPDPEFDIVLEAVSGILGSPVEAEEEEIKVQEGAGGEAIKLGDERAEKISETYTDSIGMEFALIPAGEFMMGSPSSEEGRWDTEGPVHKVRINKPFYLGVYPVTQKEWQAVMKNNPSSFKGDSLPVEQVSWNDVQKFIKKLNDKESTDKYRLPSEAEWEYAARAGTATRYSFGDDESKLGDYAWYDANSDSKTHPVGQKKPNALGLYDMHGSAWEGDGSSVGRGGSWLNGAGFCRSASRYAYGPGYRSVNLGFRLLRTL